MAYLGEPTDSPSPVMTFAMGGNWLAARVDQVDRVAVASRLWPVPLARPEHIGLFDSGQELVPVLRLTSQEATPTKPGDEQLVALLHVRGQTIGLAIERAGRVYSRYWIEERRPSKPKGLGALDALSAMSSDSRFWLIDTDRLFAFEAGGASAPCAEGT